MPNLIDLTGQRFGKLVAVCINVSRERLSWRCVCDCGAEVTIRSDGLRRGRARSCGCARVEALRQRATTHGHTIKGRSAAYKVWDAMVQRCTNPNSGGYADYGGRGIKLCERWRDFRNFYADMGDAPADLTIDRINNDGDYEPANCRWATRTQQAFNTRSTRLTKPFVEDVRRRAAAGESYSAIGRALGVHHSVVWSAATKSNDRLPFQVEYEPRPYTPRKGGDVTRHPCPITRLHKETAS